MEDLINQMKSKAPGGGQGKAAGSSLPKDRRIPIHKTQSFKGGDAEKRSQSWLGRQFSRPVSRSSGGPAPVDELAATAVAAATFAVNSMEDLKGNMGQDLSLSRSKSKKDKVTQSPESGPSSSPRPSVLTPEHQGSPGAQAGSPNFQRRSTLADHISDKSNGRSSNIPIPPPPPPRPFQPIKRPTSPAFPTSFSTMRPGASSLNPSSKASIPSSLPQQQKPISRSASGRGTKADVWEATEMEKIKERHVKLNATISSWEEGKKKKSKGKLDRTESELARRRAKAMEKFKDEMVSINRIAGGARAQADEKRKKEEWKAKEKANKYRRTGKFPRTCFCF
ncbi:hypothetical protein SAY87_018041 [Trapa incisa]|uniref:Remorin C-terminal domain-containing protein n=1 Tax=Trapa incisa TaxID=236973 RepID=A0AAN7L5D5_9MYRT|nr:hypothetical protein SAY87_018041 [Trapa incisa]